MFHIIISLFLKHVMYRQIYMEVLYIIISTYTHCPCRWPSDLRLGPVAARLLRLCVRIPPRTWKSVSCECYVLSGTGLFVKLITLPGEFYQVWCVCVWVFFSTTLQALAYQGLQRRGKKNQFFMLCVKFHVAFMQNQFFWSCVHHIKCWGGLV